MFVAYIVRYKSRGWDYGNALIPNKKITYAEDIRELEEEIRVKLEKRDGFKINNIVILNWEELNKVRD